MNSADPEPVNDLAQDIHLDEEHGHILIEYDQGMISFNRLKEAIEMAGAKILDSISRKESKGNQSVLFRLNIQDVREIVFNLSTLPLIKVGGYNSKLAIGRRRNP